MDSVSILATLRNLRRMYLQWAVSMAEHICHDQLDSQLAKHLATEKKGVPVEEFKLLVGNPFSEVVFKYEMTYEWDSNGQLVPSAGL